MFSVKSRVEYKDDELHLVLMAPLTREEYVAQWDKVRIAQNYYFPSNEDERKRGILQSGRKPARASRQQEGLTDTDSSTALADKNPWREKGHEDLDEDLEVLRIAQQFKGKPKEANNYYCCWKLAKNVEERSGRETKVQYDEKSDFQVLCSQYCPELWKPVEEADRTNDTTAYQRAWNRMEKKLGIKNFKSRCDEIKKYW